ncbi:unnamed protein product [Leptidea sinapis]|uniref:Rhabdovirus nucleocapsid domain-containing protein n=1 Tax=Leptidea sinapis TaxID=189913 RepID=A0A5E4PRP2_9NEOP|nr:unnamed protein product [Leptidea sinapis]
MNLDYACTLFMWHARELGKLTLRRHDSRVPDGHYLNVKLRMHGETSPSINVSRREYVRVSEAYYDKEVPVRHYYFSSAKYMLPTTAGGVCDDVVPDSSVFTRLPNDIEDDKSASKLGRAELPKELKSISTTEIFSSRVQRYLFLLKDISIGRSDGERIPQRILEQGMQLENFMQGLPNTTDVMEWVFLEHIGNDIDRIMTREDELMEPYSYFPYQVDLGQIFYQYKQCQADFRDGVQCMACQGWFDFPCAGITENGYRKVIEVTHGATDMESIAMDLKRHSTQISSLPTLMTSMKAIQADISDLKTMKADIADLKLIKPDVSEIKATIEFV